MGWWDTKIAWDVKNQARWLPTQEQTFVLRFFLARINILIQRIDKDSLLKQRKADYLKKEFNYKGKLLCFRETRLALARNFACQVELGRHW